MNNFQISPKLGNKAFLVRRGELEGRLDPYFYNPLFAHVDGLVKEKSSKNLGDLAISINGGGTPLKSEGDKYYAEAGAGIPLLRVQNITEEGISLEDAIYINEETHNELLARSQVFGSDLLVTITGRIASCAVAPLGFEGNINQHSVVIKTDSHEISEYLAAFLNSNVGQTLAQKRVTGGTRPALDYDALKSIPIIENLPIVAIMNAAYEAKRQKEAEAQRLLDGIDEYLLGELGIELPAQGENTVQSRIFMRQLSEISGGRFDPFFNSLNTQGRSGKYEFYDLKKLAHLRKGDAITSNDIVEGNFPVIAGGKTSPYTHNVANNNGDIITVSASGAYSGYVWYHKDPVFASDCTMISSMDAEKLSTLFLAEYLKSAQQDIYNLQKGSGQPHVYPSDLEKIQIPLPPIKKQEKITARITGIRNQAKQLQDEAKSALEKAKKEVENLILGGEK